MPKSKFIKILLASAFMIALFSAFFFFRHLFFPAEKNQIRTNLDSEAEQISNINAAKTPAKKLIKDAKLQAISDSLLHLFDKMSSVPVYIVDEPIGRNGVNVEHSVAYAICENQNQPTVFIKKAFYEKRNTKQLVNILKHELTHAYFCRKGIQAGHDERFRQKFREVGGIGN